MRKVMWCTKVVQLNTHCLFFYIYTSMYMHTSLFHHIMRLYYTNLVFPIRSLHAHLSIMNQVSTILTIFLIGIDNYVKIIYVKLYVYQAVRECGYVNKKSSPKRRRPWLSSSTSPNYLNLSNVALKKHYIDVSQVLLPDRAIFERLERLRLGLLPPRKLLLDSENIFRKNLRIPDSEDFFHGASSGS